MLIANQNFAIKKNPGARVAHFHVLTLKRDVMFIAFSEVSCHVNVSFSE